MMTSRISAAAAVAAMLFCGVARAQEAYSLPRTTLSIEVETAVETFHAGPYAEYAKKYLGIEVRGEDSVSSRIVSMTITPRVEADMSARHLTAAPSASLLSLSSQGLVAAAEDVVLDSVRWRFPGPSSADFSLRGVNSNFAVETSRLYKSAEDGSTTFISQNMIVEKSLDKRAAEAAEMVLKLRRTRIQIITGDTDMTYSGEAMGAAVEEMKALENEYLSLFTGYVDTRLQTARFELAPKAGQSVQKYVAFRLCESEGAVSADNLSGSPVVVELVPEAISEPLEPRPEKIAKGAAEIRYRIPAVCAVNVYDGASLLMSARMPVYQLGSEEVTYVKVK